MLRLLLQTPVLKIQCQRIQTKSIQYKHIGRQQSKRLELIFSFLWYIIKVKDRRGDFSPPTLYRFRFCLVDFFGAVFFLSFFMLCIRAIVAMMLAHTVRTIPIQSFTSIPFTPFHYLYYSILVRVCQAFFQTFLKNQHLTFVRCFFHTQISK